MDSVGRKVYLAGKIRPDIKYQRDWRLALVSGLEAAQDDRLIRGMPWPLLPRAIFGRFDYVGPFFTDLSDETFCGHGSWLAYPHAVNPHHLREWKHSADTPIIRASVVERCLRAIASADLVFAWIDDLSCYGTLFELGYATALGKRVAVRFAQGDFYRYTPDRLTEDADESANPYYELWFTYFACQAQVCEEGPVEALKQVIAELGWEVFPETFDSPLEAMFAEEWRAQSLHLLYPLISQQPIKNGAYRIDFAFPRYQVGFELDGYTYHSDRDAFTRDRRRQREIEALGWHIIRFSGDELRQNITACVREAARFLDIHKQRQEL